MKQKNKKIKKEDILAFIAQDELLSQHRDFRQSYHCNMHVALFQLLREPSSLDDFNSDRNTPAQLPSGGRIIPSFV